MQLFDIDIIVVFIHSFINSINVFFEEPTMCQATVLLSIPVL